MSEEFVPVLYLKTGYPFRFKLRLALLKAGLLSEVDIQEFPSGAPEETRIKDELSSKFGKVSFPAAEVAPGEFRQGPMSSLVTYFTGLNGIDVGDLPTLQAYKDGPFSELMRLFKENRELKQSRTA